MSFIKLRGRRLNAAVNLKVIFLNDGPGLLLGSMWDDYSKLEKIDPKRIMVLTLSMFNDRLTDEWLNS